MGIPRDHRRDRREKGVVLDTVVGTWADPTGSYYEVTCDTGFDGESYSCSVRIQRPNGDVFDRESVIKQFGDWTIVWGQKYVLDEAISNAHKLQWNNLRGGSGFVWQRVKPEHSRYRGYGSARKGVPTRTAPRANGKAHEYEAKNWNSWFGWQKRERYAWDQWEKTGKTENGEEASYPEEYPQEYPEEYEEEYQEEYPEEYAEEYDEKQDDDEEEADRHEMQNETQPTTASDSPHDSATETAARGSASEADTSDARRDWPEQSLRENYRWRPKLHPPPPPPRRNKCGTSGYWNKEAVASRFSLDVPNHLPKRESRRPGQYINGCVSYATSADFKDIPIYDGILEKFDKEKNSGIISSRGAMADFKQNVYVHGTVLQSSRACLKDFLCFTVHMNAHGKPQASRPLLRLKASEGYALSGIFTAASPESCDHIAGTIRCSAVTHLFDEDVQVSHELGRRLQTGDEVNFNARWIYEDNDGKLEACEIQCENPGPPPGLPGLPCTLPDRPQPTEPTEAPPGLRGTEQLAKPEDGLERPPLYQNCREAPAQGFRNDWELIGSGLAHDLNIEQHDLNIEQRVIHL